MMRRIFHWGFTALLAIIGTQEMSAQISDEKPNLEELYQQIDDAIDRSPQYVANRLTMTDRARRDLQRVNNQDRRLALAEELFELYTSFKNDSALYFADLCSSLADSMQLKHTAGLYRSLKAHQCSNAGLYVESLNLLKKTDRQTLDREGLTKYYAALMHVYGELGSYSQQTNEQRDYFQLQDSYRDSVLAVAEKGSEEYLHLKMDVLCARQLYQDALAVSDSWLNKVREGTHEIAYAAFYRSIVYDKLGNNTQLRYWLGVSALNDIKCAVNDQASLFMLAEKLCEDGDYDRAYRYMRFCEDCNRRFSPQLRNYQVRYVTSVMESVLENRQTRCSQLLAIACVVVLMLLAAVGWLLIRQRRGSRAAS